MNQSRNNILLIALYTVLLAAVSLLTRGLIPIDETRYTTVAWEMWLRGDWLVPHLNGETYSHKPALLFWIIMAGWKVFGVNEWWPRLIPFFFAFGSMVLVQQLGRRLWPQTNAGLMAPFIVLGFMLFAFFSTAVMFDMMLTFFVLLSITGIYRVFSANDHRWWLLVGIAWGLGILSKGPVIFVHTLPMIVFAAYWLAGSTEINWKKTVAGVLFAMVLAAAIVFAWVIPAIAAGGDEYGHQLLFGQNIERAMKAPNDALPWWYYIVFMPLILFPWLYWGGSWKAVLAKGSQLANSDIGRRLCLAWMLSVFILFTLISGKKVHYMLPVLPAVALYLSSLLAEGRAALASRREMIVITLAYGGLGTYAASLPYFHGPNDSPYWMSSVNGIHAVLFIVIAALGQWLIRGDRLKAVRMISLQTLLVLGAAHIVIFSPAMQGYDMHEIALEIRKLQQQDRDIAYNGKYYGEFHFVGRLEQPLDVVYDHTEQQWMREHPQGMVIRNNYEQCGPQQEPAEFQHLFRNGQCLVIRTHEQHVDFLKRRGWWKGG